MVRLITRRAWENIFNRKFHYLQYLASFQVSSLVYTGQGKVGAENGEPEIAFQLSQRADHFEKISSYPTTFERGLVNSRCEPLCGPASATSQPDSPARLHSIFFDSTLAHGSCLLKVGVMQIVLAMLEAEHCDPGLILDDRGIWHTKSESLCGAGYNRLHVICGESLCSEMAMFLKAGTTALIVAMAEAGVKPGGDVQIESPLDALRIFAADPTCRKTVMMKNWQRLTAIDIQRHYLRQAEAHAGEACMPAWTGEVCRVWHDVLERLAQDSRSADLVLDWSLKLSLYADQAAKLGIRWDRLAFWNEIVNRLNAALESANPDGSQASLDAVLGAESPIPNEAERLTKFLRSKGLDWAEFRKLLDARHRFFEIDTRFGQLGPKGIFQSLDAAGLLNHRVSGVGDVDRALTEPPSAGRAHIRGRVIRRLARERANWRCDWQYIINSADNRVLDLSNPFATEETWKESSETEADSPRDRSRFISYVEMLRRACVAREPSS